MVVIFFCDGIAFLDVYNEYIDEKNILWIVHALILHHDIFLTFAFCFLKLYWTVMREDKNIYIRERCLVIWITANQVYDLPALICYSWNCSSI